MGKVKGHSVLSLNDDVMSALPETDWSRQKCLKFRKDGIQGYCYMLCSRLHNSYKLN